MLHTINKSPYSHSCLSECLRVCSADDAIILIEDGVYAALNDSEYAARLFAHKAAIYVLQPDALARGIADRIATGIGAIDYAGFVQLCCDHSPIQSWY